MDAASLLQPQRIAVKPQLKSRRILVALAALTIAAGCSSPTELRRDGAACEGTRRPCDLLVQEGNGRNLTPYIAEPGVVVDPPGGPADESPAPR